jgi:dipeptidyl aminopeptidase/acylaminoacyl peptidase
MIDSPQWPRRVVAVALCAAPWALRGEPAHVATLEESLSRQTIRAPAISPDGAFVAFRLRETDWKQDDFVWQLWLADVARGTNIQLTRGRKSAGVAEWSPDGQLLAFVTEREPSAVERPAAAAGEPTAGAAKPDAGDETKPAPKQIWLMSPRGGEAWQLTKSETDVDELHWSRDGRSILFTAATPRSKASKARAKHYGAYTVVEKDYDQTALWLVDVVAASRVSRPAAATLLTSDPTLNVRSFAGSPDATRVAFSATHNPLLASAADEDIYLLDLGRGNAVTKIVALPGPDTDPMFSPDGHQLAFQTSLAQPYHFYANEHLAVVDLAAVLAHPATAVRDVRDLTPGFDEDPQAIDWAKDGIYFGATQKMAAFVYRLDPATGRIARVTTGDQWIVNEASVTPDARSVAFIAEDPTHVAELYVSPLATFAPRRLTDLTAQVRDWRLGTVEVVSWKSRDGTMIEGVLHKPAGYDPKRRYPLLVRIHGGPTGTSQPRFLPPDYAYPVQAFLAKGALVLEPNYRGSGGYGAAFRALNVRNLGVGDMWDVMSGVDAMIARGLADPDRLAAMGWSQGGFICAFLTTHTNRFRAISVGAGISDWSTYYVSTDITPFTRQYLRATPWDDPGIYAKTSPITTIRQARTPTLIQHGSEDRRVPVPDAFELYRGLLDQNVDARLILYTGFGHGIDKPKSALALLQANLDWFDHYLWDEPIPADSPLYGTSELDAGAGAPSGTP